MKRSSTSAECHSETVAERNPRRLFRWFALALIIAVPCRAADEPQADPTINADGDVGRTSYLTVPFSSDVIQLAWGSTQGLSPCNLHWESGTAFTNPATMAAALSASRGLAARRIVPFSGAQRWQDTFVAAQPPMPGEPPWVTSDRNANNMLGRGDYQAWVAWEKAHSNRLMLAEVHEIRRLGMRGPVEALDDLGGLCGAFGFLFATEPATLEPRRHAGESPRHGLQVGARRPVGARLLLDRHTLFQLAGSKSGKYGGSRFFEGRDPVFAKGEWIHWGIRPQELP
jgi:hypothetical protein